MSVLTGVPLASGQGDNGFWANAFPVLPHPAEFFFGLVAFAILYWIVKSKVAPRLEKVYTERVAAIEGGMIKAERAQEQAATALRQYQGQLARAHDEAMEIRERAKADAAALKEQLREQAQAEADRITAAAVQQIEMERRHALTALRHEVGDIAVQLAERVVGESMRDKQAQTDVVERFLTDLERDGAVEGRGPA